MEIVYGKTKSSCLWGCFLLFLTFLPSYHAIADDTPQSILSMAFTRLRARSFSCEFNEDWSFLRQMDAHSGTYYQLVADDGFVFRKIILFNSAGDEIMVLTSNRTGSFFFLDGCWHQCLALLPLWYFDNMAEDFSAAELSLSSFSCKRVIEGNEDYYNIEMTINTDVNKLKEAIRPFPVSLYEGIDNLTSDFYKARPVKRVFLIRCSDGMLVMRKHLNLAGKSVYERTIHGMASLDSGITSDFFNAGKTDGNICPYFLESFRNARQKQMRRIADDTSKIHKHSTLFFTILIGFVALDLVIVCIYRKLSTCHSSQEENI